MSAAALHLIEQGRSERNRGDLDLALQHYQEAAILLRLEDTPLKLAHTIRHVGDIQSQRGDLDSAKSCYTEALAIYRREPQRPPLDLANTLNNFAYLKARTGEDELAGQFWGEARDLYASLGVTAGVDDCTNQLAQVESRRDLA